VFMRLPQRVILLIAPDRSAPGKVPIKQPFNWTGFQHLAHLTEDIPTLPRSEELCCKDFPLGESRATLK
jgi:hypothetical protein